MLELDTPLLTKGTVTKVMRNHRSEKNVLKCVDIFAVFFTVFAHWLCFKVIQEVVIFLSICIAPGIL